MVSHGQSRRAETAAQVPCPACVMLFQALDQTQRLRTSLREPIRPAPRRIVRSTACPLLISYIRLSVRSGGPKL